MLTKSVLNSVRPNYPSQAPLDSTQKTEVLLLSLRSLCDLDIRRIILNVDVDTHFFGGDEVVFKAAKLIFPSAEIVRESKRPIDLSSWLRSTAFADEFFGADNPIICLFNHDHIFVDPVPQIFDHTIRALFENNKEVFLIYSHAPEAISFLHSPEAFDFRVFRTLKNKVPHSPPRDVGQHLYHFRQMGVIDGIFVTTPRGLRRMWDSARISTDYAPRPDWPGVSFGEHVFDLITTKREFFRHFDGYGHITNIPQMLTMQLSDFDLEGRGPLRRAVTETVRLGSVASEAMELLVNSYLDHFFSNYLLMIRDLHYHRVHSAGSQGSPTRDLQQAFVTFAQYQVAVDLGHFKVPKATLDELLMRLSHAVFSRSLEIFRLVESDVAMHDRNLYAIWQAADHQYFNAKMF